MSDGNHTCTYTLDPDDPETWGGVGGDRCYVTKDDLNTTGVWTCPHNAVENRSRCLFHLPPDDKPDDRIVVDAFHDTIEQAAETSDAKTQHRQQQFIGAQFGTFVLSGSTLNVDSEQPIDFTHARFTGEVNWTNTTMRPPLRMRGTRFEKEISFQSTEFMQSVDFEGTIFNGKTDFGGTIFKDRASFVKVTFKNNTDFMRSAFESGASFEKAIFEDGVAFAEATFGDETTFEGVSFKNYINFRRSIFKDDTDFWDTTFKGDTSFTGSSFKKEVFFRSVDFPDSRRTDFSQSDLSGGALGDTDLTGANLQKADLTAATLSNANLSGANLERATLSYADLFGAQFCGAAFYSAVFADVHINEDTEFGDRCVYDPAFDGERTADIDTDDKPRRLTKAAGAYRTVEQLARTNAFPRLSRANYSRRKDMQRKRHYARARHEHGRESWRSGGRWLRAVAAWVVIKNGENPWHVLIWWGIVIGLSGLLYPVAGITNKNAALITYPPSLSAFGAVIETLKQGGYFSVVTFTSFGGGNIQPVGWGRALAVIETTVGALLMALLVFVFGRRTTR